ncbi:hypothetical protein AMR41_21110 [Hapalosiphon sp. MRB220]|nr:hypothetical protein AMR41_21110 [Hapalosiphon sp. MRB220]
MVGLIFIRLIQAGERGVLAAPYRAKTRLTNALQGKPAKANPRNKSKRRIKNILAPSQGFRRFRRLDESDGWAFYFLEIPKKKQQINALTRNL